MTENMQALQHQYTSCRKGQSGSAGFQARAFTEGLRPDEQREVERRGIYAPPRNAAQEPTDEEIAQDFPRAFRYYPLESGRWSMTYSCYAGRDYSGRWGNYFAHSLIGDTGMPSVWPIDYYEWEGWKTNLSREEDTEEAPPPLPSVGLHGIPPSESFTFAELGEFLNEAPGRKGLLADMLRAVFLRQENSRALVIRDSFLNGLFWVACIQKALPLSCLRELSFSTYQYDDRNCASINATTEGTDFSFDEGQRKYQFFMFDFATGKHSELPRAAMDYAEIVAGWMANEPERLAEFHEFLRLFECRTLDPQLGCAARLFQSTKDNSPLLNVEDLAPIVDFVSLYTIPDARDQMVEAVWRLMRRHFPLPSEIGTSKDYGAFIRFFQRAAAASGSSKHRMRAFAGWIRMFDNLVFLQGKELPEVRAVREEMLGSLAGYEQELAKVFLGTDHMQGIRDIAVDQSPEVLEELLNEVLLSLNALGRKPAWKQLDAERIILALLNSREGPYRSALRVFSALPREPEALSEICRLAAFDWKKESGVAPEAYRKKCEAAGRALGRILAEMTPETALAARKPLDAPDTRDFLFGEWLGILERAPDKQAAYHRYVRQEVSSLKAYLSEYSEPIAKSLLDLLPEEPRSEQALTWITDDSIKGFSDGFRKACIEMANRDVKFNLALPNVRKRAESLAEAAQTYRVNLTPNRPLLLHAVIQAERGDVSSVSELPLAAIGRNLALIDCPGYTVFLANFLKNALGKARRGKEHKDILLAMYRPSCYARFKCSYLELLLERLRLPFTQMDEAILVFWLTEQWSDRRLDGLENLRDDIEDVYIHRIRTLNGDQYQKLDAGMWNRNDEMDRRAFDYWKAFGEQRESSWGFVRKRKRILTSKE